MNKQEIFDKVWQHFAVEKHPRSLSYPEVFAGACAYRGANNAKCAIGIFIPDEIYNEMIEGFGVLRLDSNLLKSCGLHLVEKNFLFSLQHCHDGAPDHDEMIVSLRLFAAKWKLNVPT
jgi:hypothetical protein